MEKEKEIDLIELFKSVLKRWKMIVCITLLCTLVSAVLSFFVITPKYQVSTKLFVGKESTNAKDQNYNNNDVTMYQKLLKTYAQMIQTNDIVSKAINDKKLNLNSKNVLKKLKVSPSEDTQVIEITYVDTDKYIAKNLLDSVTAMFIKESHELIPNGKVKVIESVKLPEKPVSPILSTKVDGTVFVVRAERTKIDSVKESKNLLDKVGANIVGTVLHATTATKGKYYYYYGEDECRRRRKK